MPLGDQAIPPPDSTSAFASASRRIRLALFALIPSSDKDTEQNSSRGMTFIYTMLLTSVAMFISIFVNWAAFPSETLFWLIPAFLFLIPLFLLHTYKFGGDRFRLSVLWFLQLMAYLFIVDIPLTGWAKSPDTVFLYLAAAVMFTMVNLRVGMVCLLVVVAGNIIIFLAKDSSAIIAPDSSYYIANGLLSFLGFFALIGLLNSSYFNTLKLLQTRNNTIESTMAQLTDSFEFARDIQAKLFHFQADRVIKAGPHFVLHRGKDVVSGDLYHVASKGDQDVFFVGDCKSQGVPGALMSILSHTYLQEILRLDGKVLPSKVLELLQLKVALRFYLTSLTNRVPAESKFLPTVGLAAALIVYDRSTRLLSYSSAQTPVWVLSEGALTVLPTDDFLLGANASKNSTCTQGTHALKKGDIVFSSTDGYFNQIGGDKAGLQGIADIQKMFLAASFDFQIFSSTIERSLDQWRQEQPLSDDVTVLAFCIA